MSGIKNDSVRLRILEILYKKAAEGGDWTVQREEIRRLLPIPEKQLDFNVLYLRDKKLLKIHILEKGCWQATKITGKGIDIIENKPRFAEEFPFLLEGVQEKMDTRPTGSIVDTEHCDVNPYQQVPSVFEQAYEQVKKIDILAEKKQEIEANLKALENELPKQKPNKNKISAIYEWLEGNAEYVIPIIAESVTKVLSST
jgi:hypothetical protein